MKTIILIASLSAASMAFSDELHHFNEVKLTLLSGKSIHIVTDFANCATTTKNTITLSNIGVFSPESFLVSEHIATSSTHFTVYNNSEFHNKAVYEFIKYTLTSDDNVNIMVRVLDAASFLQLKPTSSWNCKMDMGVKIFS